MSRTRPGQAASAGRVIAPMSVAGWLVIACITGCGRFNFDPFGANNGDGGIDAVDVGYFISPTGNDTDAGTRAAPWRTFTYALGRLVPGDQLNLLDGEYDAAGTTGPLSIDCNMVMNGTAGAPISLKADHPRRAHVRGPTKALLVTNCAYWGIDGLWLEDFDDPAANSGPVAYVSDSNNISVRGLLVQHPNRYGNNNGIEIALSMNVTVTDTEIYDFHRGAVDLYYSTGTTVRRLYANGRGYPDIAGGYATTCPGGDHGVLSYYSYGGIIEDSIAENICDQGFGAGAGRNASGSTGLGDGHLFVNDIALGPGTYAFESWSDCSGALPCDSPDRYTSDNVFRNSVAIGFDHDFMLDGVNNQLDHVTALAGVSDGVSLEITYPGGALPATAFVTASLVAGSDVGIVSTAQTNWGVASSNVFGATTAYSPNDVHVTSSTTIDPLLGGCGVYLPPGSPMLTAGPGGSPIGADIRFLTLDGVLTTNPYWKNDGAFSGCSAIVAGVNDDPATACSGVHQRLHVGSSGCALP